MEAFIVKVHSVLQSCVMILHEIKLIMHGLKMTNILILSFNLQSNL